MRASRLLRPAARLAQWTLRLLLALLNEARVVADMDAPGLRLHSLKGDLKGHWAVTVQANWRVTFRFVDGDAHVVDYQDYH